MSRHGQASDASSSHPIFGSRPIPTDAVRAASLKVFENELAAQDTTLATLTNPIKAVNGLQHNVYANLMPKSSLEQLKQIAKKIPVCSWRTYARLF